ncbi:MAG: class I SAM-dependent methyltransferase [Candidatus Eisenbacteria bacterium]
MEQVKARHRLAWGLDVDAYVRHTTPELAPVAERLIELAGPAWGASVIDIACGPGTASFPAAQRVGPGGRVQGVDLASAMVAWAERRANSEGVTHAAFAVGDAEDLADIPDGAFDVAISNFGVIFAPDAARMVDEAARVLKPGGVFAMSVWLPVGMVAETLALLSSISPPPPAGASTSESWGEPGVAEQRLGVRFDALTREAIAVPCDYASVDLAWQRMREGRPPFALAFGRLPAAQKAEVEEQARAMFRRHAAEDGHVRYVREAVILSGVRRD